MRQKFLGEISEIRDIKDLKKLHNTLVFYLTQ